jgi:hypothetical protein
MVSRIMSSVFAATLLLGCASADGGTGPQGAPTPPANGAPAAEAGGALSVAERDGLTFTREEEKLARDVYAALRAHDQSFDNVGQSEQTHMDAIATLLTRYGLPDPAAGKAPGAFSDASLQALHDALVRQGTPSLLDALAVGVEIEELDIHDIETASRGVTHADIADTYANLTRGSRNHLRTFYSKLVAGGGSYVPKHVDEATFRSIVESPMERGR